MKRILSPLYFVLFVLIAVSASAKGKKALVFSKTAGFHHSSIPVGILAIMKLGKENGFSVDTTTDESKFTSKNLRQYAVVIFLNTTGDVLDEVQQHAFELYIKGGGGFVGVHAATDTEYDWAWYGNLVGAYFGSHPSQQEAVLKIDDPATIATKGLPSSWKRKDEWYNFKWLTGEPVNILISIDETSYSPGDGAMGTSHPMSWYHDFDGGRSFYTELGHTEESYADPLYLQHLLGGIQYAIGSAKMKL